MTFYVAIVIITELLMFTMSAHVLFYRGFNKVQKSWFLATFIAVMICSAAEYAVHCGGYNAVFKIPLTILTVIQFSVAPVMAMLFAGALGLRYQGKIAIVFFGANLLMEILLAAFGKNFYFDANGYQRGDLFILYEIVYGISLAYLLVSLVLVSLHFKHRDVATIGLIVAGLIVGGIVPMTFFKLNVAYLAIGVAASLCYIFYNDLVQQDTKDELVDHERKLSAIQSHIISGMANLIESRDTDTGEHVSRTSRYVKALAEEAREKGVYSDVITDHFIILLYTLAPMHDVGKIVVSDQILKQPRRLTKEEFEVMKKHAKDGGTVVKKILDGISDEEYIRFAADIATYHHERWDGTGYPLGLKGEDIPLSARIMAIADVFDALISKRCYKNAIPVDEAFEIIRSESGTHFDPNLVEVFLANEERFRKLSEHSSEENSVVTK